MPHKFEKSQHFSLTKQFDARCKYSQEQKEHVKHLINQGISQRSIARMTGISRRLIAFILDPQKEVVCKSQFKERRKDGRYYDKEKHKEAIKSTRRKKLKILRGES